MNAVKTLKGIVKEYQKYFYTHVAQDEVFISELKKLNFPTKPLAKLEAHYQKIHADIFKDLKKSEELLAAFNKKNGIQTIKEINKIFSYTISFNKLIYGSNQGSRIKFGRKSELDYLNRLIKLYKEDDSQEDKEILNLIKRRIITLSRSVSNQRIREIEQLRYKLSERIKGHFKIKRKLIDLNRPKINEVIKIGNSKVYIEIFFDKDLRDKIIADSLENSVNILDKVIGHSLDQRRDPVLINIQKEITVKKERLKNLSLRTVQELWLKLLKEMIINLLKENQDLILTPTFRFQLKIINQSGHIAYCSGNSLYDNYMFGLEINALIIYYLIGKNFYESVSLNTFSQLINITDKKVIPIAAFKERSIDIINQTIGQIIQSTSSEIYRTFSLYNTFAHETEHAFDRKYLLKKNKLHAIVNRLISESDFYENHKTMNYGPELIALAEFYFDCRTEAPTQFREFIVSYQSGMERNEVYSLINPINALVRKNLKVGINDVMRMLEKRRNDVKNKGKVISSSKYPLSSLSYAYGHMINMIIFLADCKKKGVNVFMIDDYGYNRLLRIFPRALPILTGFNKAEKLKEGSPEWFLVQSIKKGTTKQFLEIMNRNKIKLYNTDDVRKLINHNKQFFIFRPSIPVMKATLKKIEKTNIHTYLQVYDRARQILGVEEKIISINDFKEFAEKMYAANTILLKKEGFHN